MTPSVQTMLERYSIKTLSDRENALKEILQEICLAGLWRSKFFEVAAFYGGTALRIFYDLPRFSEDLDFTLLSSNKNFSWANYEKFVVEELEAHGFAVSFKEKKKSQNSQIKSAFLKTGTYMGLLEIEVEPFDLKQVHQKAYTKIKVEVDTTPDVEYLNEQKYLKMPLSCPIRCVTKENLFAGKTHAAFFRGWKDRVKGRDWYDFVWFIQNGIPLDLSLFSNFLGKESTISEIEFLDLANEKIASLNVESAKQDVSPFVNEGNVNFWSHDFFKYWLEEIKFI